MRYLLILLLLSACSDAKPPTPVEPMPVLTAPAQAIYQVAGGEVRVLQVPIDVISGIPITRQCILWRDTEFKTASLQCPTEAYHRDPP